MKIKSLLIKNYRGLNNVGISFNENNNYLVGKNNVGKTSTLKLIEILLSGKNFQSEDFNDISQSICITMKLILSNNELGVFSDNFSPDDANEVAIQFIQKDPDDQISAVHFPTGSFINTSLLKRANYVSYSSNIKPIRENDLTVKYGDYKLIPQIVEKFIEKNKPNDLTKTDYDENLIEFVNTNLKKIRPFKKNDVSINFANNYSDFVARALILQDSSGIGFSKLGFGLQFSSLIPLKIIDKIIQWDKYKKIDDHLITAEDGTKRINIILTVDEPEVHLHPNLQLQLMKYIRQILSGKDFEFNDLLKQLFDIDLICGQLFVVTHSPNILSNDYSEISRFTENDGQVIVASGHDLKFDMKESKQLNRQLPYVSMSLFADAVIIIEGETEQAAFPVLAEKLNINLTDHNINVINAGGVKNIPTLSRLFSSLKIKTVSIIDNDGKGDRGWTLDNLFVTEENDFEYECYKVMSLTDINHYLRDFEETINGNEYDGSFWFFILEDVEKNAVIAAGNKVSEIDGILEKFGKDRTEQVKKAIQEKFIKNFLKNKSVLNGELVAQHITKVPSVYESAIRVISNE